jgi:tetratricopeptide (TPR) repeat protein
MRFAALALILLCGCSPSRTELLDGLFEQARVEFRAGELDKAQRAAEHGLSVAESRHEAFFQWKFRLLRAEILLYGKRAEEVLPQLSESMPSGPEFAPLAARQLMLRAQAASILGQPERSAALLAEARRAAEAAQAGEVLVDIENIQGLLAWKAKHYDDAERFLRSALQRARVVRASYPEASILVNLGMIHLARHRYDEAVGYFEEASSRARGQFQVVYSSAQANLALCYSTL